MFLENDKDGEDGESLWLSASASPLVEFSLHYKSKGCCVDQGKSQNEKYLKGDKRYSHISVYKVGGLVTLLTHAPTSPTLKPNWTLGILVTCVLYCLVVLNKVISGAPSDTKILWLNKHKVLYKWKLLFLNYVKALTFILHS